MDEIKPVAWADVSDVDCLAEYGWSPSELYSTKVMDFYVPLYSQHAIETLRAEVWDSEGAVRVWRRRCQEAEARAERAEADANNQRAEVEQLTSEFLDLQREMNLWQDEALSLRKLCLEAVGRVSVLPDGGDLHDRLVAATAKDEW